MYGETDDEQDDESDHIPGGPPSHLDAPAAARAQSRPSSALLWHFAVQLPFVANAFPPS